MHDNKQFAIVDIETTGGYAGGSRMTEIAIYIHNGKKVIDSYQTLLNPQQFIPFHIQSLTGISNEMVEDAPLFQDVAAKVFDLLDERIFVAHNVNFDYSFVHAQLKDAGFDWKAPKLCTVRLARKFFSGLPSYSLGKLCNSLNIKLENRHRAAGDAEATVVLFEKILKQDKDDFISQSTKVKSKEQRLPNHIEEEVFERLPNSAGIYIFLNQQGKIIYVGKAINIKKRVLGHFTGNNSTLRRQQFLKEIYSIDYQESGTELMAFLMECHYIKKHWPRYNAALKKYDPKYGLVFYEDQNGYYRLSICKVNKNTPAIYYFNQVSESTTFLRNLINDYELNSQLCSYFQSAATPLIERIRMHSEQLPEQESYNQKVQQAINALEENKSSYVILDKGRNQQEKSYIYVKDNKIHALGFIANDMDSTDMENVVKQEDLVSSNYYMLNLASSYAERFPHLILRIAN